MYRLPYYRGSPSDIPHGIGDRRFTLIRRMALPPAWSAGSALFAGFREVNREVSTIKVFLVQGGNRLVGAALHFHKPETAQPPAFPVGNEIDIFDRTIRAK